MHAFRPSHTLGPLSAPVLAALCGTVWAQSPPPLAAPQTLGEVTVQSTTDDDGYSQA